MTCFVVTVVNYTEEANNRLILMKNEEQAFIGNSKDNDISGIYTHFHKYGLQPMRKTTHLFWPEWCSSTLHDVKKFLPFPLDFKQKKEKGIKVLLWPKQVRCFAHWL